MTDHETDEAVALRKIRVSVGRMLVKAARRAGISLRDYNYADQFNNYTTVIWTPICIWTKSIWTKSIWKKSIWKKGI